MRRAPAVELNPEQRKALQRLARQRSIPARWVERARIVLLAAAGLENRQIAAHLRVTPEKAARWRKRFLAGGMAALEKDAPRPGLARPYRCPLYPWLPLAYIVLIGGWLLNTLIERPTEALACTALMAVGVPWYLYWKRSVGTGALARPGGAKLR